MRIERPKHALDRTISYFFVIDLPDVVLIDDIQCLGVIGHDTISRNTGISGGGR